MSAGLSRRKQLVVLAACLSACTAATARERNHEREPPRELRYIDQAFEIGKNACTIESARERVTEAKTESARRAAPDLRVLDLSFRCRTASDRAISFEQALPNDALVLLVDSEGNAKAPSTRTWLHAVSPEHVFFELDEHEHALPRARRYDAARGTLKSGPVTPGFELWLSGSGLSTRLRLHKGVDQAQLAPSIDALISELTASESPELSEVRKLHRLTLDVTGARTLQIDDVSAEGELRVVSWSYRDPAHAFVQAAPRVSLELAKADQAKHPYRFSRARELASLRSFVRCSELSRKVEAAAQRAFAEATAPGAECNVAGVLWPTACDEVPIATRQEALAAHTSCMGEALTALEKRAEPAPSDLQITMRRGRSGRALDRTPRYTLSLFASGATVFHALVRGDTPERRDGRTSTAWIAAVMRAFDDLAWFDRKGGRWGEDCDPRADDVHVLTVHARERERMVLDREGCRGPFSARELSELFELVERVGFASTWTAARPEYADRQARIWTIAAE